MNSKGFIPILIAILIAAAVGGYLVFTNYSNNRTRSQVQNPVVISQTPQPTVKEVRPDDFNLATAWQMGLSTYSNPQLGLSFQYPTSFTVIINDTSSYPSKFKHPSLSLKINTLDVPLEKRQKPGFDFNAYDANTMTVHVVQYDNSSNQTLDNFLSALYSGPGIDGKTPVIVTLRKNLVSSNTPKAGSYLYVGVSAENPTKIYFFTNKDKVYNFSLSGGNNTGQGYSKDAENIFDQIVKSISFD